MSYVHAQPGHRLDGTPCHGTVTPMTTDLSGGGVHTFALCSCAGSVNVLVRPVRTVAVSLAKVAPTPSTLLMRQVRADVAAR